MSGRHTEHSHSLEQHDDSYYNVIQAHSEAEIHQPQTYPTSPSRHPTNPDSNNKYHQSKQNDRGSPRKFGNIYRRNSQQSLEKYSRRRAKPSQDLSYLDPDFADPDNFFENFDKLFKVRDGTLDNLPDQSTEAAKPKNIRRILLDDFTFTPSRPFSCEPDSFPQERLSTKPSVKKEKTLPQLDNVSHRPSYNVNADYQIQYAKTQSNQAASKDVAVKDLLMDTGKLAPHVKIDKDTKLPDLKVPRTLTSKPSSFSKLPINSTDKIVDKIQKFNENYVGRTKPRTSVTSKTPVNTESVSLRLKNSHNALQDMLKSKKAELNGRQNPVTTEENKGPERRNHTNNEVRTRMNSVQNIDKSLGKGVVQKNDLSLDFGSNGNGKVKFILRNLEQRTSGYYQGVLNKINTLKDNKNSNATTRSHYAKENNSMLSNSSRDKALEGLKLKEVKEITDINMRSTDIYGTTKNSQVGSNSRAKVADISQIYKGTRPSIKLKGPLKPVKNIRVVTGTGMPLKEIFDHNTIDTRSISVPRR